MSDLLTLKNRVAFVTGGAQGMGFSIARMMSLHGMKVVVADINADKIVQVARELNAVGGEKVVSVACDVSDENSIEVAIKKAVSEFHQLDVVVNCAGILSAAKIRDITRKEWDRILAVNLSGTFFTIQKALPYLQKSKAGRIINISSTAGRMGGVENSMSYSASKGGVCAITKGIARQLGKDNITVNAICPGPTATDIVKTYTSDELRNLKSKILLGRLASPDEIATAACFLASEEGGYITGAMIDINGGFWIG